MPRKNIPKFKYTRSFNDAMIVKLEDILFLRSFIIIVDEKGKVQFMIFIIMITLKNIIF